MGRIPDKWVNYMKSCIKTILVGTFSTTRMVKEYSNKFYLPALKNFVTLSSNIAENATKLHNWKRMIRQHWTEVEIIDVSSKGNGDSFVGKSIKIYCKNNFRQIETSAKTWWFRFIMVRLITLVSLIIVISKI